MSKLTVGFWTAWEVNNPERNKLPAATPTARNTVAAVTIIRILILTSRLGLPFVVPSLRLPPDCRGPDTERVIVHSLRKASRHVKAFGGKQRQKYFRLGHYRNVTPAEAG